MAFDGTEGGAIPLADASAMTKEYRLRNPNQTLAHFFGKVVGADSDENDILDIVADLTFPCPNTCSNPNPLNS